MIISGTIFPAQLPIRWMPPIITTAEMISKTVPMMNFKVLISNPKNGNDMALRVSEETPMSMMAWVSWLA